MLEYSTPRVPLAGKKSGKDQSNFTPGLLLVRKTWGRHRSNFTPGVLMLRKRLEKDESKFNPEVLLVRKTWGKHKSHCTLGVLLVRKESGNNKLGDSRNLEYGEEINFLKVRESFLPRVTWTGGYGVNQVHSCLTILCVPNVRFLWKVVQATCGLINLVYERQV